MNFVGLNIYKYKIYYIFYIINTKYTYTRTHTYMSRVLSTRLTYWLIKCFQTPRAMSRRIGNLAHHAALISNCHGTGRVSTG